MRDTTDAVVSLASYDNSHTIAAATASALPADPADRWTTIFFMKLMRCWAQALRGPMASPAFAEALWHLSRDPRAAEAAAEIARDPKVHQFLRVQAVIALADMSTPTALHTLRDLLQAAPEYLIRYHCFKGLLVLHGYSAKQADDHVGPLAPHIAGAHLRPAACETMMTRLAELLAGRTMVPDRGA